MEEKKRITPHTILLAVTLFVVLLTWIIPGGYFDESGVYHQLEGTKQGLWHFFAAPVAGFMNAIDIILFVLVIGAFITMVMKTGALQALVASISKKFEGHEYVLIVILMLFFGFGGTTYGMSEETVAFYAIVAPVMVAAGFDVVVALLIVFLGSATGVLASTVNPFAIGAAVDGATAAGVTVGLGDGIISRTISFVLFEAVAIGFTIRYAMKIKSDPSYSIVDSSVNTKYSSSETYEFTGRRIAIMILFALSFIVMVMSVIPWDEFGFNGFIEVFDKISASKLGTFLGFGDNGTGTTAYPFGWWWFGQLTVWFLIMTLIIGVIYSVKNEEFGENEIVSTIFDGFKDFIGVAAVIGIARGIVVVLGSSGLDATILHYASDAMGGLPAIVFVLALLIFFIGMTFLIPSTSGLAGATMPIIAPLSVSIIGAGGAAIAITAFSFGSGITNVIAPTGVAIIACSMLDVPYGKYVKLVMPLLGIFLVMSIGILSILTILA